MIKIVRQRKNLSQYNDEHYNYVKDFVISKLSVVANHAPGRVSDDKLITELEQLHTYDNLSYDKLKLFAAFLAMNNYSELQKIIKCLPNEFTRKFKDCNHLYMLSKTISITKGTRTYQTKVMYPVLKLIFDYDAFSEGIKCSGNTYSAFELVDKIGLRTCPYCNRQYITPLEIHQYSKSKQKTLRKRPHLDHFYPRSKYPIFGISFYNLIPSCSFCNSSFKGSAKTTTETHIHPYIEGYSDGAKFRFKPTSKGMSTKLVVNKRDTKRRKRILKSSKLFELEKVYKSHDDVAQEIYDKSLKHSRYQAASIRKILSDIKSITKSEDEFYQFYFGNFMNESDYEKRPLAKFTADLVDELGIVRYYDKY